MNEFFNKKLQNCKIAKLQNCKIAKLFFLTTISALAVGCNEDDALMDESPEEVVQTYEFFELAKGDTLPKYIHRQKPIFDEKIKF